MNTTFEEIERLRRRAEESAAQADDAWPEPTDIKTDLPAAPQFEAASLLPKTLREFVLDEADRMCAPPDYVAAALVVALGSVIGAKCAIKPKRRDDWIIVPNLYGGVVGDPASKKTPAISTVMRFLDRLEARSAERHAEAMKVHEAELAAFAARQAACSAAMKKAAGGKGDGIAMEDAVQGMQALIAPEKPSQRRYKTNDATVQKIADIMVGSPAGLLVYRDELIGLLASWDREGHEVDRAFYLEGWNGTGSFNVDRIARGSQFVKTVCLGVFGGIQPELFGRYLASMAASLDNDGRVQRFQVLVYPEPAAWEWRDRYPVKGAREGVRDIFDRLAEFDPLLDGASPADDFVTLPWFAFDDQAQEVFVEWSVDLHRRIDAEQNPLMKQHLAKYEKLFCAVSLIMHLAEGRIGPVKADSALRAAAWCEYLAGHARRVYGLLEAARVGTARTLGRRLAEGRLADGFTARDVVRKGWTGIATGLEAEQSLSVLEEHAWVMAVDTTSGEQPGRPTTRYYINPKIRGAKP